MRVVPAQFVFPALGLLVMTIAWRVITLGLADHFARSDPDKALGWRSNHPMALLSAAEQIAHEGTNPGRAEARARAALAANPMEGRAYRVLGQLAMARKDETGALKFYQRASRLSPRDIPTHMWLEAYYFRSGKPVEALRHVDMLLRLAPERNWQQYNLLQAVAGFPPAHAALAAALLRHPPWRERFMAQICAPAEGSSVARTPLINILRKSPEGLSAQELSYWINCLSRDRRWGEAYLTWVSSLPKEQKLELANVFNGGFEHEPSNMGFDWLVTSGPGFMIERVPTRAAGGEAALRVSFEEGRVQFNHLRQQLVLSPGKYRLHGRSRAEGLRSERGLVWSIQCVEGGEPIATTKPVSGVTPWIDFSTDFQVPPKACSAQWLQLAVPARSKAEQRIGGRAWFDDIGIIHIP